MAVQKALKPKIIGSIFCAIRDDVLNIIIENDGKKFEYSIDEITEKIRTGYPVDSVVRYCYDMYKVFILSAPACPRRRCSAFWCAALSRRKSRTTGSTM